MPDHFLAGYKFSDLLFGVMDVFITIRKLFPELVGLPFNFSRPPATHIIDRGESFFGGLVYHDGSGVILAHFALLSTYLD